MLTQFHEKAQKIIVIAESIAFDLGHSHVGSEHLLLSLLKIKDLEFCKLLKKYDVTDEKIQDDIIRLFGEKDIQPFYMEYSESVKKILEDAIEIAKNKQQSKVMVNDLIVALMKQEKSVAVELLNKYHVDFEFIEKQLGEEKAALYELDQIRELVNMNKKVLKEKRIMIGRDNEIQQLFSILCKKEKNNALLIGKAGVGKTALIEKLAYLINEHKVPIQLEHKVIYELSLSSLVAGTKYRGEFEEKFNKILDKVINAKDAIVFIDEIHNLIGAGGAEGAIDASNILKPFIARKQLTLIGATTLDEYYRYFEKDQAMNRRFGVIKLNENSEEETLNILKGLRKQYEDFHCIKINDARLKDIIDLSKRYLPARVFPDKALDVLDLSCVKAGFNNEKELTLKQIQDVIEEISGLVLDENLSIDNIEIKLNKEIIGQKEAIHQLCKSLSKRHITDQRPEGIYLLMGSSGIGKTETVKKLAELLRRPLVRLDMSEYSESVSVTKLIGSPPGYVGYDQQTSLFSELVLNPHCILLLDEVEKAHPQVLHLFLQGFDEGVIKDSHHRLIQLSNCIVIMTSNVMGQNSSLGFKKKRLNKVQLEDFFSKEFLNRIDETIVFRTLDKEDLREIALKYDIEEHKINELLDDYDISLGARLLTRKINQHV
ncbi:MAG: ATP-dependent Clp protease ATP-binding subunit [Bacilli bacterium]|nr:ATP-dependent Clp protease ATP-binding subunit [Bacilli bacterium]